MSGTTPASGQITLANLQSVFGGTNPINFSEYYQNALTGYTSGVSGIPNIGTQISLSNFYNKTKPGVSYPPVAVQTNQYMFGYPLQGTNGLYLRVTGASGTNLTRPGGSTFNNIQGFTPGSPPSINCQNLILQAKAGDQIRISIEKWTGGNYTVYVRAWYNLGGGWFWPYYWYNTTTGFTTFDFYYTIPSNLLPGNYGIGATCQYYNLNDTFYVTSIFYSLHVVP